MILHKDFIEYAECNTEVLVCKTKALSIAELIEQFSDESNDEKECACCWIVESMQYLNENQAILQKLKIFFFNT